MKRLVTYLTITIIALGAIAGVFSAKTTLMLSRMRTAQYRTMANEAQPYYQSIIKIDDISAINKLEAMGIKLEARFGNMVTASIPTAIIDAVAEMPCVRSISLAQPVQLCNGKALEMSFFPTASLSIAGNDELLHTGDGVVVGVIDVGVDFNHINFLDKEGNNRIVRAYLPDDSTGTAPVIDGMTLPGSHYTTPEQILALTTDDENQTHGTHTTGTAAGSYMDNGYNGVATGASLVICAMPESHLTDANIANSIKYIFDYADQVGLPAVINMSLGSQDWAHDGTSPLCQVMDSISGPGRICVVSAGNDANMPISVRKKLGENDSLATFLSNWTSREVLRGYSSMWSLSATPHTVDIVIWDLQADTLVHRLDIPHDAVTDSVYTISSDNDEVFAQYFTGELYFACALEENGKYHSLVETNYATADREKYRIGIIVKAPAGETIIGWSGSPVIYSDGGLQGGWISGTKGSRSISDLATGDMAISVGAYGSTKSFTMMDGSTLTYSRCIPGDIAYFSGYGPDTRGINRPDVVAPGLALASSVSRYYEKNQDPANVVDVVEFNGEAYPYGVNAGTSMSTPVVVGSIALWLEMMPDLAPSDIREILQATCYSDEYVALGPARWGYGKLNIDAGVKYLLNKLNGDVNNDGAVNAADVTALYNIILGNSAQNKQRADVNADDSINAADVTAVYNTILGN